MKPSFWRTVVACIVTIAVLLQRVDAQPRPSNEPTELQILAQLQAIVRSLQALRLQLASLPVPVAVATAVPTVDPCSGAKTNVAISQTASTRLVVGNKRLAICSAFVVGADAENLALVEGTGTTCGTGTAGVIGGTTAANGPNMAANGGWVLGNGQGTVAVMGTFGNDLCLLQSGTGRVAGNLTYVSAAP